MSDYIVSKGVSIDGQLVFARPRPPTKREGRRGTRKAWKREHPPGDYWLITRTEQDGSQVQYLERF